MSTANLVGVQALRGVAAMLVVLCHASQMVHYRMGFGDILFFGASGVDVFFPISGFVMVMTTYKYWGQAGRAFDFLVRRLIRIVPIYWVATLLKALIIVALPALTANARLDPWHTIASFLFIPAWDAEHKPFPLIPIGWTLQFEMFFYLLFAAVLALRLRPVLWLGGVLLVVSLLPRWPALGAIGTLADPILLEFVAGMLVGWATASGRLMSARLAVWVLPLCFIALALTQLGVEPLVFGWRLLVWGLPGTLALAAVIALEPACRRWLRGLPQLIGDASYAIYLSHGFVLPVIGMMLIKMQVGGDSGRWLALALCCAISAGVGVLAHLGFEKPLTAWLGRLWQQRKARQVPVVQTAERSSV